MTLDSVAVVRSPFSIADPWQIPPESSVVTLRRSSDGAAPRLATTVALLYDGEGLSFLFTTADDHVVASLTEHDAPLYEEDVVEVFLSPGAPDVYFEVEVSPAGAMFDARIVSPDGRRETMVVDRAWHSGAFAAIRTIVSPEGERTSETLLRIPFSSLGCAPPEGGETWRGNLFRIDRHPLHDDEYTAWRPTFRHPPDFHVPASFGTLRFLS